MSTDCNAEYFIYYHNHLLMHQINAIDAK